MHCGVVYLSLSSLIEHSMHVEYLFVNLGPFSPEFPRGFFVEIFKVPLLRCLCVQQLRVHRATMHPKFDSKNIPELMLTKWTPFSFA